LPGITRSEVGRRGVAGGNGRKRLVLGRRDPKGKTYFPRRRDRRAGWMGRPGQFQPMGTARSVGWLGQRPNGPRGRPGRKQGKEFLN
jgi:hypothetical protein